MLLSYISKLMEATVKQNRTGGNDVGVVDGPGIKVIFVAASYFLCLLYWSRDVTGRLGGWWDVDVEQALMTGNFME